MDIITALSKIWGFFLLIFFFIILEKLFVLSLSKKNEKKIITLGENHPKLLNEFIEFLITQNSINNFYKKFSHILNSEINDIGVIFFEEDGKGVFLINKYGKKQILPDNTLSKKSNKRNNYINLLKEHLRTGNKNRCFSIKEGKTQKVHYLPKTPSQYSSLILVFEIKIENFFSLLTKQIT